MVQDIFNMAAEKLGFKFNVVKGMVTLLYKASFPKQIIERKMVKVEKIEWKKQLNCYSCLSFIYLSLSFNFLEMYTDRNE